jgi:hypothetical protein
MKGRLGAREGGGLKMALLQRVPFVSGGGWRGGESVRGAWT